MILLVDDEPNNLKLAARVLGAAGYATIAASSISAAVAILAEQMPRLMLVDLLMKPQNGLDLVRGVRANPAFAAMPIIVWTAYTDPELRAQVVRACCQGYLVKAVNDNDDLVATVKQWVPHP